MKCKICENIQDNKPYQVREMMFGFRDVFSYFECSQCGCLQIDKIPTDMTKYYPSNYYSYSSRPQKRSRFSIDRIIKNQRNIYAVLNQGAFGRFVYRFSPSDSLQMLSNVHPTRNTRILDVGCGSGSLLYTLKEIGFTYLLGLDPYIVEDVTYQNGLKIMKKSIDDIADEWDLIMFHHSFEHIPDPVAMLQSVSSKLAHNGTCLIRIPTVSSYAWKHYKVNWVQLDAPRHFFLHSVRSISLAAAQAGLEFDNVIYDSTDFQFWGSEQYLKNIPLTSPQSYSKNRSKSIFTPKQIKLFKEKARHLNSVNQGDCAAFILRKK